MPAVVKINDQKVSGRPKSGLPESVRSLTHDLRTPLTSVKSSLDLVLKGEAGGVTPEQRHFLGLALRNIDRLDRMIEGVLTAARPGDQSQGIRRREVDLGPILKDTASLHRVTATARGLEIDDSGLPDSFRAQVDSDLVVRMLDNVLGNALKYTRPGGLVRVWLETGCARPRSLAGRLARHCGLPLATFNLIVEDNGPGLSSSVQSRIFEPFNSGSGHDPAKAAGTGLGLSITRRLAEAHGGTVRLISLPGRGTTVWIKLPRDVASGHLQQTVGQLEAALAGGSPNDVQPLLGVLDLRQGPSEGCGAGSSADEFFAGERAVGSRCWELAPGLWVATVMDPVNWSRRWTLFAARKGMGLETVRWEYLAFDNQEERAIPRRFGEQRETMVNPEDCGPMIGGELAHRHTVDKPEDG
ncbi:MAG: HAMP domain-containing sensor histidine kinase [Candidatus Krumholzibacteriota bacterium]